MKIAIILFVLMYVLIIFLPKYRMAAALGTAVLFMILGILPMSAAPGAVNWNALMMMGKIRECPDCDNLYVAVCRTDLRLH